jgi:hypothetical protein
MIIQQMLKEQETKIKKTIQKENKSFDEIFDVLDYYLFNSNKIENKEEMYKNINDLTFKLLISIDKLREEMFEACSKNSCNHSYMDRLDLLIRFLPKNTNISNLITVKNILEEDFDPTYDL